MANRQKPDNVHLLQGTYKKSRHGDQKKKPQIKKTNVVKPEWLKGKALEEWNSITAILKETKLLTSVDKAILAQYCELFGQLSEDPKGFSMAAHTQLRMCQQELGFTPAARSKIILQDKDDDDDGF